VTRSFGISVFTIATWPIREANPASWPADAEDFFPHEAWSIQPPFRSTRHIALKFVREHNLKAPVPAPLFRGAHLQRKPRHLLSSLKTCGALPPLHLYTVTVWCLCTGAEIPFTAF
jgi:hypothetical protein